MACPASTPFNFILSVELPEGFCKWTIRDLEADTSTAYDGKSSQFSCTAGTLYGPLAPDSLPGTPQTFDGIISCRWTVGDFSSETALTNVHVTTGS
ncbi:MAG: hypothetical protein K6G00_12925 [Treponema sp.]|nr:hypothetical protein [Treponema sp.]